jgi:hypothetical protein
LAAIVDVVSYSLRIPRERLQNGQLAVTIPAHCRVDRAGSDTSSNDLAAIIDALRDAFGVTRQRTKWLGFLSTDVTRK